jgi:hypothetical protein
VSYNKIGDVLVAQGDGPGALAAFRKSLPSARSWPHDPTNAVPACFEHLRYRIQRFLSTGR